MEKFIPYEKLSKKQKRALDAARRGSWGGLSPVTRRAENPKAYQRKKARIEEELDRAFFMTGGGERRPQGGDLIRPSVTPSNARRYGAPSPCAGKALSGGRGLLGAFVLQARAAYGKVGERTREGMTAHEAAL